MRSLTATQLAAQRGTMTRPTIDVTIDQATAYDERTSFVSPSSFALSAAPLATATTPYAGYTRNGTLSIFHITGTSIRQTNFSAATPPVQSATSVFHTTDGGAIAAASDGTRAAIATIPMPQTGALTATVYVDTGSGFAAPVSIVLPHDPLAIALAWSGDGRLLLVYANTAAGILGAVVRSAAGSWGAAVEYTTTIGTVDSIEGLAATYSNPGGAAGSGDWLIACGINFHDTTYAYFCRLSSIIFGDGSLNTANTWGVEYVSTTVARTDGANPGSRIQPTDFIKLDTLRLTTLETYESGGGGNHIALARSFWLSAQTPTQFQIANLRAPCPINTGTSEEWRQAYDPSYQRIWAYSRNRITYATRPTSTNISTRVWRAQLEESETAGKASILLDNSDLAYQSLLQQSIIGQRVTIRLAYITSNGVEYSAGRPYWVTGAFAVATADASLIELMLGDAWELLAAHRPLRPVSWPGGFTTILDMLIRITAIAGIPFTSPASPSASLLTKPAYTWTQTHSAAHAIHDLLDRIPEVMLVGAAGLTLVKPLSSDPTAYTYAPQNHDIITARATTTSTPVSWAKVFGRGVIGPFRPAMIAEAWDTAAANAAGAIPINVDTNIDDITTGLAEAPVRASTVIRKAQLIKDSGEIATAPNIGLEIWDPIACTFPSLGWSAQPFRVRAIHTHFDRLAAGGIFTQSVGLMPL